MLHDGVAFIIIIIKLYLFTLTPSTIADFQGGRDNKKKTMYIIQIKTVNSSTMLGYRLMSEIKELKVFIDIEFLT